VVHSITSSARASREGGTVRPRAFAALTTSQRLPAELFKRFVFDFRDGQTGPVAAEIEPELYALLVGVAKASLRDEGARRHA
jgi:hypothetical protein